jgi:hypothetical protein
MEEKKYCGVKIFAVLLLLNILLSAKEVPSMEVSDLILDYSRIEGTNICVQGEIISMGDISMLRDRNNLMASVNLNTKKLSRNLRKNIMQKCTFMNTCLQIVCGVAQDVDYDKGLIVNKII